MTAAPHAPSHPLTYASTRGGDSGRHFTDVLLSGLAADGGLFVPSAWPGLPPVASLPDYNSVAHAVLTPFVGADIPSADLRALIDGAYNAQSFDDAAIAPLKQLDENFYLMELFHGPTLSFKDLALQLLGRLFDYALEKRGGKITILGATSGDTGSAAIEACRGRKNISVTILHPLGRTSEIQRRQMTSVLDENVTNIAVEGTFDDCQNLVKRAFADEAVRREKSLSAVNSINWARIAAQTAYYTDTVRRLGRKTAFAVPSGNFGNIYAAWVGKQMGVDVGPLVLGSNRNDILTRFFETGEMRPASVAPSHSPSMDIQISSNFERFLFECLDRNASALGQYMAAFRENGSYSVPSSVLSCAQQDFTARRCSDEQTVETIAAIYKKYGEIVDPHTAVGIHALQASGIRETFDGPCVALACAHPVKFPDVVEKATGIRPKLPDRLADLMEREERVTVIPNDYEALKKIIL